ncbi:MAG: hypothetical protein GX555_17955 [Actinomycetales bacterium]|nr:hypothetical protein [Actinomycetales bacterium]
MRTRIVVGTAILALAVTACSSGGGERLGTGDDYSVLGALAELPARPSSEFVMVQTGDLTAASELAGLQRPETADDGGAVVGWISSLLGAPTRDNPEMASVFVPVADVFNVQYGAQHDEFHDALGWSLVTTDSFVELSTPPHTFAVVAGDFDESVLADLPEVGDGVVTFGEGEDFSVNPSNRSAVSQIGQPVRMARQDGRVAVSGGTEAVADWLAGQGETLADDTALADVASALDEQDVVSAVLVRGASFAGTTILGRSDTASDPALMMDQVEGLPSTAFGVVGLGWAVQDGEPLVVVAYRLGNENAAEVAVPEFEAMYREGESLRSARPLTDAVELLSVEASGTVLVVQVRPTEAAGPRWLLDQVHHGDVPFLHQ